MTVKQRISLVKLGVDIEAVLDNFCKSEDTYLSCLDKFTKDLNYVKMLASIESRNASKAFEAAHSLKGVAGSLGFGDLFKEVSEITEVFRAGSLDYDPENLQAIKDNYVKIINTINSL